jgi:hypothetical protein
MFGGIWNIELPPHTLNSFLLVALLFNEMNMNINISVGFYYRQYTAEVV